MNVRRERGSVALTIGLSLPVLIGMVALGTEITFLLYKQRQMQSAADAAALGGATALQSGHPALGVEARGIAGYLGFIDGTGAATVTVNNPPLAGPQQGNTGAVEVIIAQPQSLSLVKLFTSGIFAVSARAVAVIGAGSYCVLQLGNSGKVDISNGVMVNMQTCGLSVNGSGSSALSVVGGSQLNAQSVSVVGRVSVNNGGSINPSSGLKTSQSPVADPYANVVMPPFSGCNFNNFNTNSWQPSWTLVPGVYCGSGLSISNGATAVLKPGVYFIDQGLFYIGGGAHVSGTGVTIVLTSSAHGESNYANAQIDNGATVTLTAPTSGATAGIVFFGDRGATPSQESSTFAGGTVINFTGAVYLPTQTLNWNNGANNTASPCTQLIAGTIVLQGANLQVNCPAGVASIGATKASLVE